MSTRSSGRKRTRPDTLSYASETVNAEAPLTRSTPKRQSSGSAKKKAPKKVKAGKNVPVVKSKDALDSEEPVRPLHRVIERPSDVVAHALVGSCVRIDWPSEDEELLGTYTAMIIRFDQETGAHLLFYFATACAAESTEEVFLYDGSRHWEPDVAPRGKAANPKENVEIDRDLGVDVREYIGRQIGVEWPVENSASAIEFYDAVIVDRIGSLYQLVYQADEYIERRDLVRDSQRWRLRPAVESSLPVHRPPPDDETSALPATVLAVPLSRGPLKVVGTPLAPPPFISNEVSPPRGTRNEDWAAKEAAAKEVNLRRDKIVVTRSNAAVAKLKCSGCDAVTETHVCSGCRTARYCGVICAKSHWKSGGHNKECLELQQRTEEASLRGNAKVKK